MRRGNGSSVRRDLGRLFEGQSVVALGEPELLDRFVESRDGAAFEALVTRHGPMVLGVCRRLLANPLDVEDAFQATFLIFIRRAGSIKNRDRLAPWLFGVARKVASRARGDLARRKAREVSGVEELAEGRVVQDREENQALLDEIDRLPDPLREPILLCCIEGLSYDEAAARMQSTAPAVRGRLARARQRLREKLNRRGFAPSVVAWTGLIGEGAGGVTLPARLLIATTQVSKAGTFPASVQILADGVIRTMIVTQSKVLAAVLLTFGVAGSGVGVYAQRQGDPATETGQAPSVSKPATQEPSPGLPPGNPSVVYEYAIDGGTNFRTGPFLTRNPTRVIESSRDKGLTWTKGKGDSVAPSIVWRGLDADGGVTWLMRAASWKNPEDDRLSKLENKLDRVLEALEGAARPAPRPTQSGGPTNNDPFTLVPKADDDTVPAAPPVPDPRRSKEGQSINRAGGQTQLDPLATNSKADDDDTVPAAPPVPPPLPARSSDGRSTTRLNTRFSPVEGTLPASPGDDLAPRVKSEPSRIEALEKTIARLEARIARLERQHEEPDLLFALPPAKGDAPPTPPARSRTRTSESKSQRSEDSPPPSGDAVRVPMQKGQGSVSSNPR